MNPKQFLLWGGIILILVAILGFVGVIGPTADDSIFGEGWWFDNAENWAHLIIGIIGVLAAFVVPMSVQKPLVLILGIIGVIVGIYSIFTQTLGSANLENPADTILHLVVGAWALWAGMAKKPAASMPQQGM